MPALIVIGSGKKGTPPPPPGKATKRPAGPPPPPGSDETQTSNPTGEPDADDQPLSPEEVGYGENDLCQSCKNMGDDGTCQKYHFAVTETGHCLNGYEPKDDQQADLQGVAA